MRPARAVRVTAGVGLLVVALATTGAGAAADGLGALDPPTLLAGAALAVPATVACAWRWRAVARGLGVGIDLGPGVAACYRAQLLNSTLPGGVVGDVHRGLAHGRAASDLPRAARAVVTERAAGQVVLVAVAVPLLVLAPSPVRLPAGAAVAAAAAAVVAAVLGVRALVGPDWPGVVVASLVALACHAATFLLAARAVGVTAPVGTLLPLVSLVFLAAAVPANVAGWGPREGVAAWAFGAAGLGTTSGLAASVAFGATVLVAGLPGAVVLLAGRRRRGGPVAGVPAGRAVPGGPGDG